MHIDLCIEFRDGQEPTPEALAEATRTYEMALGGSDTIENFVAQVSPTDAGDVFVEAYDRFLSPT